MARTKKSAVRQALILAFGAGALTGVTGTLALRRRHRGDGFPASDVAGQFDEAPVPSPGVRLDGPAQASRSMVGAQLS